MAALSEDMIMEIVARLPLKNAIQCLVLNKSLFRLISQRKNDLVSSSYPDIKSNIFYHSDPKILTRFGPGNNEISMSLPPRAPNILDSCNGVLLIGRDGDEACTVFNPITGGIMFVGSLFSLCGAIKLAVDLQDHNSTTFHFKLVNVVCKDFNHLWEINILAPTRGRSGRPSWLVSSPKIFERGCSRYRCCSDKSVYANGCMYWPQCKKPDIIIVLDVEKEEIGTISWPFSAESPAPLLFGLSDGSLQSVVCELQHHEIAIRGYDVVKHEWVLKHKISNVIVPARSSVEFFDGQRLLIIQQDDYGKNTRGMIHDILSGKWDKISVRDDVIYRKTFFSFVPSLAKVSDEYLDKLIVESYFPRLFYSIAGLQHLITQESNAWNNFM